MAFQVSLRCFVSQLSDGTNVHGWYAYWQNKPEALIYKDHDYFTFCYTDGKDWARNCDKDVLISWFEEKRPDIAAKRPVYHVNRSVESLHMPYKGFLDK